MKSRIGSRAMSTAADWLGSTNTLFVGGWLMAAVRTFGLQEALRIWACVRGFDLNQTVSESNFPQGLMEKQLVAGPFACVRE